MASDVVIPEVGETGMDVTFVRWLKAAGDPVAEGDVLFELDTDKTVVEVEAWTSGTLVDLRVGEGDVVAPRQVIARILAPGETAGNAGTEGVDDLDPTTHDSPHPAVGERPGDGASSSVPGAPPGAASVPPGAAATAASPRARRLARERGVDLAAIAGTGAEGMVTERDVLAALGEAELEDGR
jgi:pyruvate dehydrogenase E2 component (dihydrolipoamide acetyltransferase)